MQTLETEVLVIGGGPVGLSTALHLDAQGIDCILVERHPSTAFHPKASYFNVRTMEILRQLGIASEV
jgi:2-polyprenyl-6-methoxyphenol hydroxylase-like FAD-dependent oxidoreductase